MSPVIPQFKAEFVQLLNSTVGGWPVIRAGARVVEVGTGLGIVTATLAARAEYVHTYEPIAEMRDRADALLSGQGVTNVTVHAAAVGTPGCDDRVTINHMSEAWNSGKHIPFYDHAQAVVIAPQVPLDQALRDANADTLLLDCEGGECDLLPATDLTGVTTLIVEWHPHIVGTDVVEDARHAIQQAGFRCVTQVFGELRPGGFAEVAVYRWDLA